MLLVDGHLDLAWNAVSWDRDLEQCVAAIRVSEKGMTEPGRQTNTVAFPEMRQAGIGLCLATVVARTKPRGFPQLDYASVEGCFAAAVGQYAYYQALVRGGKLRLIRTRSELEDHINDWNARPQNAPFGIILSMECADPIIESTQLDDWWGAGLRFVGPTHYGPNRYGGGTNTDQGLTSLAPALLRRMETLGVVLDTTHLSDRAFWEALDIFGGRVIASHQNARKFCDWNRQFSDEQIKAVIERDGIIGTAMDVIMLQPDFRRGESKPEVTMARAIDNIDHVCQLAGNVRHAAVGSDLDGGYGYEQTPTDLNTISDLRALAPLLEKRGYATRDIAAIFHGNWLRFFAEVLPQDQAVPPHAPAIGIGDRLTTSPKLPVALQTNAS
jgi:membrane dipeptidase